MQGRESSYNITYVYDIAYVYTCIYMCQRARAMRIRVGGGCRAGGDLVTELEVAFGAGLVVSVISYMFHIRYLYT